MTLARPGRSGATPRLGIRVSTAPSRGRGHIARCLTVGSHTPQPVTWFIDPGQAVTDIPVRPGDQVVAEASASSMDDVFAAVRAGSLTHVLVDSYAVAAADIAALADLLPTAAFADAPPYPAATLVIDPQPTAQAASGRLAGVQFLTVDPSLLPWRGHGGDLMVPPQLLVAFGAVDSVDRTSLVLEALLVERALAERVAVTVVQGAQAPHLERVRDYVAKLPVARLVIDPADMGPVYAETTLAVGAPGVSHAERLLCGVPTVLVAQNQPQERLGQAWAALGAAVVVPPAPREVAAALTMLLDGPERLSGLRSAGLSLIDGQGGARIAGSLTALLSPGEPLP